MGGSERDAAGSGDLEPATQLTPREASEVTTARVARGEERPTLQLGAETPSATGSVEVHVGPYELFETLGEGGMGVVYRARRSDGLYSKDVALKRLKVASADLARRFVREREILGALVHPGIAGMLDGGTDAAGNPYLVLEFVDGVPLSTWVKRERPSLDAILAMAIRILDALAYAHARLVVHCDLKPANVLVDARGQPKLVDFGIARTLDGGSAAQTVQAFTPHYAAPEQLTSAPPTALTDLYSFAVMLYELCTGKLPYTPDQRDLLAWQDAIAHAEPVLPSLRTEDRERAARLSGELDAVLLKALEKDPERRYPSAAALAAELTRWLDGFPVTARAPSLGLRLTKFLRRHRIASAAAAIAVIAVLGGAGVALSQWRVARLERDEAERQRVKSEAVGRFLEQMLSYANPLAHTGTTPAETTIGEVAEDALRRIDRGELDGQPAVKAEILRILADDFSWQGRRADSRQLHRRWIDLVRSDPRADPTSRLLADTYQAGLDFADQEFDRALAGYRDVLPRLRAAFLDDRIAARDLVGPLTDYAYLRRSQGDSREAERSFREALVLAPKLSPHEYYLVSTVRSTLASTLADQGQFEEALITARQAVAEFDAEQRRDMPDAGFALNILGGFLTEVGDEDGAAAMLARGEALIRHRLGAKHLWLGDNLRNQALLALVQRQPEQARTLAAAARAIYDEGFGERYDHYPTVLQVEAEVADADGHPDAAEALFRRALQLRRDNMAPEHYFTAIAEARYAAFLRRHGRATEAAPLAEHAIAVLRRAQGPTNPRTRWAERLLETTPEPHPP